MKLDQVRAKIDAIDPQIRALLMERLDCSKLVRKQTGSRGDQHLPGGPGTGHSGKTLPGVPEDRLPEYLAVVRKIMETSRMYQYGMLFDWNPQLFAQLAKDIDIHSGGTRVVVRLTRPDQHAMSSILNMVGDYGYNMQYMELLHFNKPEQTVTFDLTILGDLSETNMQKLMFPAVQGKPGFRILKNE